MSDEKMKELEELCKPVAEYLKKNYNPYYTLAITGVDIKLISSEMFILIETAQEVPVQKQHKFVPTDSYGTIYSEDEPSIKCPSN